jgi:uncharacterized protein (DUF488 family)
MENNTIWTIGHSTHTADTFRHLLESFDITCVADVRHYPGSGKYPHFNSEALQQFLKAHHVGYVHFEALGGRRKPRVDSPNTAWRNAAFRGYADYMETAAFRSAVDDLQKLAREQRVACMCAEAVWWRCHRSLIADYLKHAGWEVIHILGKGKGTEHPYTAAANIIGGKLTYSTGPQLF